MGEAIANRAAVSKQKLFELKCLIARSGDVSPGTKAKEFLIWMVNRTEGLTKPIGIKFGHNKSGLAKDICYGIHDMRSPRGSTHLSEFLKATGVNMIFGSCCDEKYGGWAAWIAEKDYPDIEFLTPDFEMGLEIGSIDLALFLH